MKILRIIARLNVGGPARHVVWLTKELQCGEFESELIAGTVPTGEENMGYLAASSGVEPVYIEEMSRELSLKDAVALLNIYWEMRRFSPDIVHTHTAKAGTVGRAAAFFYRWLTWKTFIGKPRRVKIVHTFHGHVFHSYYGKLKTRVFITIEKILARFATDKIVVITGQQFEEIHNRFGIGRAGQFEVIPLGIDLEQFAGPQNRRNNFRHELGVADGDLLVGFVGRLTEIKNLSLYIKVAALVESVRAGLPRAIFVIVGDGHMRAKLEDEVKALDLNHRVIFAGNRTDTENVYAGLDVVALTSLNEGTPLSLIEAMASERPVISTGVGGVVDLLGAVEDEKDAVKVCERGVRVDNNSPHDYLNGLIYLLENEKLRERLGKRGAEFVRRNYSKDRLVNDIKELYRKIS